MGVQLIYRTTRQFQLTDSGRTFYERCKGHIGALNEAVAGLGEHAGEIAGPIRVTAPEDLSIELLPGVCDDFLLHHPKVTFDVLATNRIVDW